MHDLTASSALHAAVRGLVLAATLCAGGAPASAQERAGAADKPLIGMSAPLTGANASYGTALAQGVRAALARASQGAEGARPELMLLDDAGQPEKALANTRTLLQARVAVLTGYHGAAVLEAVMPLLDGQKTPLVGAASSAESLRAPPRPWLFNLRASAGEESAAMVYHLDTLGIERIAAIAQNDGLGRSGLDGIRLEMVRLAMRPVAVAEIAVKPSAAEAQEAVDQVCRANPQAVLLALGAGNALAAIRHARRQDCRPQFYLLSESGNALASAGASAADLAGVVVSQVLPSPTRAAHPLVADYLQDLARIEGAAPGYTSLEGYLYGRAVTAALRLCGRTATGDCVIQALERGRIDLPGYRLHFGREQRRGSAFVELTLYGPDGRLRR